MKLGGMAESEKKEKEEGVRFNIEKKSKNYSSSNIKDEENEADTTDSDLEDTIPPATPRPSITAAIRRGSYYGDVTSCVSIMDIVQNPESDSDWSERSSSSTAGSFHLEESADDANNEELLSSKFRVYIIGFFEGMLERISLLMALPGTTSIKDTRVDLQDIPDGLSVLARKKELLDAANLIHFSLGIPSKLSKFMIEGAWLVEVFTTIKKEVNDSSSFTGLQDIMDKEELKIRRLSASITHVKEIKENMNILNVLIETEAQTHKEAMREWAKNITERKKELKKLRADNMVQYRYKADTALASGDLCRRTYEVRLINLRKDSMQLKHDLEVEKKVHESSVEFLKKQNIDLREEAVTLSSSFEIDTHNLDYMLEKMKLQKKEIELVLAELEPRYIKEMIDLETAKLEAIKQEEYFYANQGKCELELVAVMRIQRIWRGSCVRKVYRKVLKKLKRKRLKGKKKGKKRRKRGLKKKGQEKKQ